MMRFRRSGFSDLCSCVASGQSCDPVPKTYDFDVLIFEWRCSSNTGLGAMRLALSDFSSGLELFDVRGNSLQGGVPSELGQLPALTTLLLADNAFDGALPPQIANVGVIDEHAVARYCVVGHVALLGVHA